jgi:hypothetical protein
MLYGMGLVVAAFLVGCTVLLAMGINWLRDHLEQRRHR